MTNAEMLAEAEAALHRLITGAMEVEITTDQGTVKFAKTEIGELRNHVNTLRRASGGRRSSGIAVSF